MEKARQGRRQTPSTILVRLRRGIRAVGWWQFGGLTIPAAIGRTGRSASKREGDGATPIAAMSLLYGFVRGDKLRSLPTPLSMRRIAKEMSWCDQPENPNYNRLVKRSIKASPEEMMRGDGLYDICLVLDWNITSRRRNRGSATSFI